MRSSGMSVSLVNFLDIEAETSKEGEIFHITWSITLSFHNKMKLDG